MFSLTFVASLAGIGHAEAQPLTVEAVRVEQQALIEEVPITGTVTPLKQALLSTEVEGLVQEIRTDVGREVGKGDLLLILDPELNAISRDVALAEVARAREALADSRRRFREAQALIADQHIAESEVESLASEVRVRDAQLQAAEVEAERQAALLRRHNIVAPFSGIISQRHVDLGEWVEPGINLFELVDTGDLRMDFRVPQRYYARIQPQDALTVKLDTGHLLQTTVESKVPLSRDAGRTFLLRTQLKGKPPGKLPALIPGMSASAVMQLTRPEPGIAVPRDAVLRYPDGRITVWVADTDGDRKTPVGVREQVVRTGLSFNGLIEITSGLKAGQIVITRGNESLQPGQTVLVKPARR